MNFLDYLSFQTAKGQKEWHNPYNEVLEALKNFLGDKGIHNSLGDGLTALESEIQTSRDGKTSLLVKNQAQDALFNVDHNSNGTHQTSAGTATDWKNSGHTVTYLSANSFSIPIDVVSTYVKNLRLKIQLSNGKVYSSVASASYSTPNTTIIIKDSILDNTLQTISYGLVSPGPTGSIPTDPQVEVNSSNVMRLFDEIQEDHGGSLLMEAGWSDSFGNANEQGADEANSSGFQHDSGNTLYKGSDPGTNLNFDRNYDAELNFFQQEWTNANQSTSQATVASGTTITLSSGIWPANCTNGRISFDNGLTWFDITSRDSSTQITLVTMATDGTFDYIIRLSEFNEGTVKFNIAYAATTDLTNPGDPFVHSNAHSNSLTAGGDSRAIDDDSTSTQSMLWYNISSGGELRWVAVDIGVAAKVNEIVLNSSADSGGGSLKDFKVYGSNTTPTAGQSPTTNGATLLHTETAFPEVVYVSGTTVGPMRSITFTNNTAYNWYYVVITAVWSQDYCRVHEIELKAPAINAASEYVSISDTESQKIDTSAWADINSASATEILNSQNVYYWLAFDSVIGFDDGTEIKIFNSTGNVWRKIARNNSGAWEYNNDATDTASESWTNASTNDLLHAVSEAIATQASNRMTGTNLASISDTQWEETGGWSTITNSIVRGLTLYSTSENQTPSVSQFRLNYDSERGAMDLRSKTYDPGFEPNEAYLWTRLEHSDIDGPGTFYVSRNGGIEWTAISMVQPEPPISGDIRILRGIVDLSGQSSGQDLRCRFQSEQGKDQFLHSWGLQVK